MERKEAVALLKELGNGELFQPSMVLIEQRKPERFQLRIKGDYDPLLIKEFLKAKGLSYEENNYCLIIFKP